MRLSELFQSFEVAEHITLKEYFNFLLDKRLGHLTPNPEFFPELETTWDYPCEITNAIIDIVTDQFYKLNYSQIFSDLHDLNCHVIQLRFFEGISNSLLEHILQLITKTRIKEIRILTKFSTGFSEKMVELIRSFPRITEVFLFGCQTTEVKSILGVEVIYSARESISEANCGEICKSNFAINIPHFTEAMQANSCLNRKVSVDAYGNIKNCPSDTTSYGYVGNQSVREALLNEAFVGKWKIRKDDIEVCRDCEFRYICTDCRIFIENRENQLSKPSKCSYDPYTATWA